MKFLIIGAGAWGCAVGVHLKRRGHEVSLVCRDSKQRDALRRDGENKLRLPGVKLEGIDILAPEDLQRGAKTEALVIGLPSHAFEEGLKDLNIEAKYWVSLAKGIVLETLTTPCETLEKILKRKGQKAKVLSLAGPTHAESVAKGLPCAMVLGERCGFFKGDLRELQEALSSETMRVYVSHDRRGTELGGALKNSLAVAAGVCDGLKLGDNAKAGLLTRALAEMARLGVTLGGNVRTFFGLTGAGDLMATAYGEWSRNRQLGERVAKGEKAEALVAAGLTAEGYRASKGLLELAHKHHVSAPILEQVVAVLYNNKNPKAALQELMERPLKKE